MQDEQNPLRNFGVEDSDFALTTCLKKNIMR